MGALNEIPILWVLDLNIGSETDDIENPYGSGRVTVGSAAGGNLRTLIEHENMPDGIDVSLEDGGYIVWTQMGSLAQNNGVVQRARLDGTEVTDIFRPGEVSSLVVSVLLVDETRRFADARNRSIRQSNAPLIGQITSYTSAIARV